MIVLVTGGREYDDESAFFAAMDALHAEETITLVIHGVCVDPDTGELRGADRLAEKWAISRQVDYNGRPAKWAKFGKRAGPMRNQNMNVELYQLSPDGTGRRVVACPGGSGTRSCCEFAKELETQITQVVNSK